MSAATSAPTAPAAPAPSAPAPSAPAPAAIPEVSSMGGAQGVRPAPSGTIPAPLRPFSERPDSAKSKMMERLQGKAGVKKPEAPAAPAAPEAPAEDAPPSPEAVDPDEALLGATDKAEATKPEAAKVEPAKPAEGKKEKPNPWKMHEAEKKRAAELERELSEIRKLVPNTEARKAEIAELESVKANAKKLEDHIRFLDYQQHPEFKEKYEKPYNDQWKSSMKELKGVQAAGDEGERNIEPSDMVELVNLPITKAKAIAQEKFGDYAEDVMRERAKIRERFDSQQEALEKAKVDGGEFSKRRQAQATEAMQAMSSEVRKTYDSAVESLGNNPKFAEFFKPIEGDEEANSLLQAGYEMVDEAFAKNPMDPSLTAEQRATIVKKHAATRHRAAGFGRARYLLNKERTAHTITRMKLAQYEQTVPNRGSSSAAAAPATGAKGMAGMLDRLRAKARH